MNPNYPQYKDYGGRGVDIAPGWVHFENFLAYMGDRPPGTTLERKDNGQGYWPGNCYWATRKQQQRNRRANVWLELDGVRKLQTDWAKELGVKDHTLAQRLAHGWDLRAALTTPPLPRGRRRLSHPNEPLEMMKEQGIE